MQGFAGVSLAALSGELWIGGSVMRLGWLLLPDASGQVLSDGWNRTAYRPRHGRPPIAVRTACGAATALGRVRERYLGAGTEDLDLLGADSPGARRMDMPNLS